MTDAELIKPPTGQAATFQRFNHTALEGLLIGHL